MRQVEGPDGELLQQRDNCPQTCSSATGNGQGSVCRCCEAIEHNHCSYYTSSVQCPLRHPEPRKPDKLCCAMRVLVRNLQRYVANGGQGNQNVCC